MDLPNGPSFVIESHIIPGFPDVPQGCEDEMHMVACILLVYDEGVILVHHLVLKEGLKNKAMNLQTTKLL